MKKLTLLILTVLSVGLFQACKSNKNKVVVTIDTAKKVDSSAIAAHVDTIFADKAALGGLAEVALGKLALNKTDNTQIKRFANMMITDHGKANTELARIANEKHITLPTALDKEHQSKIDSMGQLSGKEFDKAYINMMIDGHQKTLALMQDEAKNGKEADLRGFAAQTAPIVQMHLDSINKINAVLK
jgi:putative membrane protein